MEINLPTPKDTLDAAIAAAIAADPAFTGDDGRQYVALPQDHKLHELKDEFRLPPRPTSQLILDDRTSLVTYTNRHKSERSIIIADYDASTINTRLDWHPSNTDTENGFGLSGACAHTATLKLRLSEEFKTWDAIQGKLIDQTEFAAFLEQNAGDVSDPDAATMIEISRDFEATSGQTYKSFTRLQNGDRKIVFTQENRAENEVQVPEKFILNLPIYHGEEPSKLVALFRWRPQSGAVVFGFQWHRIDNLRREQFYNIAKVAAEETGLPLIFGRP